MASKHRRLATITFRLLLQRRLKWTIRRKLRNKLFPYGADIRNVLEQPSIPAVMLDNYKVVSRCEHRDVIDVLVPSEYNNTPWLNAIRSRSTLSHCRIRVITANHLPDIRASKAIVWIRNPVHLATGFIEQLCDQDWNRIGGIYFDGLTNTSHGMRPVYRPSYSPVLLSVADYLGPLVVIAPVLFERFLLTIHVDSQITLENYVSWTVNCDVPWLKRDGFPYQSIDGVESWAYRRARLSKYALEDHRMASNAQVSIIIPSRNSALIDRCLSGVFASTDLTSVSIWVIANGDRQTEVMSAAYRYPGTQVLSDDTPFNWSHVNNTAANLTSSEILVFLNDDVIVSDNWLPSIRRCLYSPKVGVVGAKLLYETGEVQHAGVCSPSSGVWVHRFQFLESQSPGYMGLLQLPQEVSAVTGALLATRREVFNELSGFDERYSLAYNDIDYCLRSWREGYSVVYAPDCVGVHQESTTRNRQVEPDSQKIFLNDWGSYKDPYFPKGLTRFYGVPLLNEKGLDL